MFASPIQRNHYRIVPDSDERQDAMNGPSEHTTERTAEHQVAVKLQEPRWLELGRQFDNQRVPFARREFAVQRKPATVPEDSERSREFYATHAELVERTNAILLRNLEAQHSGRNDAQLMRDAERALIDGQRFVIEYGVDVTSQP